MTDERGATQMSYEEDLMQALQSLHRYYPKIIEPALNDIKYVLKRKDNAFVIPRRGHHVINKGVTKLYKDIIKNFFDVLGGEEEHFTKESNYGELESRGIINEHGLPNDDFLQSCDIPYEIKSKIDCMTVEKPFDGPHYDINAQEFVCAKIALLTGVNCVMLDIHKSLTDRGEMPKSYEDKLTCVRNITTILIEKDKHGVYVDSVAKLCWYNKNPGKVQVFEECIESVRIFLQNITDSDFMTRLVKWVNSIGKNAES